MIRVFILCLCLTLSGCKKEKPFRIGVTAGPHAMIAEIVKEKARQQGFSVEVVEFNEFILPNQALAQGEIDMNIYQHLPYLENQIKTRGYKLKAIGKTVLMPLRGYSKKISRVEDLSEGAKIAIPNDPTNSGRALKLLEATGLIKLKVGDQPTPRDIMENSKNIKIIEVEAPQVPRILEDVDIGISNTDWFVLAGLDPDKALIQEQGDNPYANVIVVRQGDEDREEVKRFVALYQTSEVKEAILKAFKKAVIPVW